MLSRYKVYEDFFGIEKRAAHYKVKKEIIQENDLKTFEKFIAMLSVEDIEKIIKFVDEESPTLNIQLKRNKTTHKIKSSVKITHELVTVAVFDGNIYQAYKDRNKKSKQILDEHKNKLLLVEQKRQEILESEENENDWLDYCKEEFEMQTVFQSFDAYKLHKENDLQESIIVEEIYRCMPTTSNKSSLLDDYGAFLYAQESIQMHCSSFFKEKIDLIADTIHEKDLVKYLIQEDTLFSKYLDVYAQLFKLTPELLLYIGKESFTILAKKYFIDY